MAVTGTPGLRAQDLPQGPHLVRLAELRGPGGVCPSRLSAQVPEDHQRLDARTTNGRHARVRAPELVGRGGWINTGGLSYALADFRGRFCLLDFWTFCCVNCLHVLDELRPLEEKFSDVLVVVGIHSPKFVHEAEHEAVVAAAQRYEVRHPVLDDPDLVTWDRYAVRAWPTLALVDPEGYLVAQFSGEGHAHGLDALLTELVAEHELRGTLHRGEGPFVPPEPVLSTLRFPAAAVALPSGQILVADAGHHALTLLAADGETALGRIGSGEHGFLDGPAATARFHEPNGLCLLPPGVAAVVGYDVVVADTVNHALRGVRLADGNVVTVAGTGEQWRRSSLNPPDGAAREQDLSSPWDVVWSPTDQVVRVAMAGTHQLWDFDPVARQVRLLAGTNSEGLRDGPADQAWFAQPSGLAVSADQDGERLWIADAETSSLRSLRAGVVVTHVGHGLFEFGHKDGPAVEALLQHPLGVTALPDGSVAVLDTYNDAVRRYDPATGEVSTLATGLREPSGALLLPARPDGHGRPDLLVVESAAHRLTRLRLPDTAVAVQSSSLRTRRPVLEVGPGELDLAVVFEPPPGQKLDARYGPASRLLVSASPPELLVRGEGSGQELIRRLVLAAPSDALTRDGVLHVAAFAASCDEGDEVEFPACHVHQQDWGIPVRITPGGDHRLVLVLRGMDAG